MIELRAYTTEDYVAIVDAVEPFSVPEDVDGFVAAVENGIQITGVEDGEVMACGGIAFVNETDGIAWLKISKKCVGNSLLWGRTIKEAFKLMIESVGDLKVRTYILKGFCRGDKLARLIGLSKTEDTEEDNGNMYYKYVVA